MVHYISPKSLRTFVLENSWAHFSGDIPSSGPQPHSSFLQLCAALFWWKTDMRNGNTVAFAAVGVRGVWCPTRSV